ncbi:MAG TPA: FAD-dependent oxidoreductase [Solirubrobacteraceae bacterium]|nr:FAD-dependent oxidoreductase [Solirubrobacteraceae bacterium]
MGAASGPDSPLRVVVAGGGVAGAEALLALRELAGDRVSLTLVSPGDAVVLPALSVAEPFALGHAEHVPLAPLLAHVDAERVPASLSAVEPQKRRIRLDDGAAVEFDALVLTTGAHPVAAVEGATTWWPRGDPEAFGGLLRDLEEGYVTRVAFVIPPGAVWPLPLYELALMTAREVQGMGITDAELTVITPEAVPLTLFGPQAAAALRDELQRAGVALEVASVARVQRHEHLEILLRPSERRLAVDRVVALPAVEGPRIPGTAQDVAGFIEVEHAGRMRGCDRIWAAGDAVAYPVKFGGLATQQADIVAADIAAWAGASVAAPSESLHLTGVLMTGGRPRSLGDTAADTAAGAESARGGHAPLWRPEAKVFGAYLSPYLAAGGEPPVTAGTGDGVAVDEDLPAPSGARTGSFHALWRADQGEAEHLRRLGFEMRAYEARHRQAERWLREHGQLRRS